MPGQSQLMATQLDQFTSDVSATTGAVMQAGVSLTHSSSTATSGSTPITTPALYNEGLASSQSTAPVTDTLPSLVSIGRSLPLLPRKLIQQIKAGEFIDFAELPPAKGRQITPANYNTQILFVQLQDMGQQRKLIPDYLTWSQCFAIYTAVVGPEQPHRIPEFMAYQLEIAKCAKKYKWPSWVIYDTNFRQQAANTPGLSWASIEPGIYSQCFTNMPKDPSDVWCKTCHSLDHPTAHCPTMPPQKIPRKDKKVTALDAGMNEVAICRNYNTKGCTYPHCARRHICLNCREKHPLSKCKELALAQMKRSGNQSST